MPALEPPAIFGQAPSSPQEDVIEVVGTRNNQSLKIDRRTYQVQQTPHSAQKNAIQLLRGIPAVTVSPDDQINLLGASGVKILIDGHQTQTDLHTLHGSDIERIEIITNPSAQYSAVGSGGIINIVLRKKQGEGLSGDASLEGSSLGRAYGTATFKYRKGKWTFEVSPETTVGEWRSSNYRKLRSVESVPGDPATINSEKGGGPQRATDGGVRAKVTYDLDSKTSLSAMANVGGGRETSTNRADFLGVTPDFESFSQIQRTRDVGSYITGLLTLDHKGSREGETLKASIWLYKLPRNAFENSTDFSNGGSLVSDTREEPFTMEDKIDWEHPIGKKQILSLGSAWNLQQIHHRYDFTSSDASLGPDVFDQFRGRESTVAAYATFQQQIGTWTVMPGVRVEQNSRSVTSPGVPNVRVNRTNLFPTFHAEHSLSKALLLTLSYSKRIDRPGFDMLRPYPVVQDVLTISEGNPALRDQSTDSYEINLHYHRNKIDAGVIVYDRQTSDVWSASYVVNAAGQSVYSWVNAGRQRDSGAEIDVTTPIVRRVKATVSVNLFDSKVPIDVTAANATDERFRFTTNSTLEWDGPDRHGKPGDIAQLQWQYQSPQRTFQTHQFAWNWLTLSYTHNLSRTLSLTATADSGPLHQGHRLVAPLVQEYFEVHNTPQFKLKLMKTFGKP